MAVHDFRAQRLFVEGGLSAGMELACARGQANYLLNVLRLKTGDAVLVFNGRDGEWRAEISETGRRDCRLTAVEQVRAQAGGPDIDYLFAPLKRARLDYMVQKATELGVQRLRPVLTRHTQVERVNMGRMQANVIEAAEQCGILRLPEVTAPARLDAVLEDWEAGRRLIFCDEGAEQASAVTALSALGPGPLAVLIGPEGGFDQREREMLAGQSFTVSVSLGPRIMRADTAAVAALSLVNAILGDWG